MSGQTDELADWVTTREAAVILGITPAYVGELVRKGTLEGFKIHPRLLLVQRASLHSFERKRSPKRRKE